MSIKRTVALGLVLSMAVGAAPAMVTLSAQGAGKILGRATDEAKTPYTNYSVLLRDVVSGQVVTTVPLDPQGLFTFNSVDLSRRFQVELLRTTDNKVVCTEGPYALNDKQTTKQVNINCGNNSALWLIAAGAGAAAAVALAVQSKSK